MKKHKHRLVDNECTAEDCYYTGKAATQGPWHWEEGSRIPYRYLVASNDETILEMLVICKIKPANKKLIEAAPELLKALKEIVEIELDQDPESRNVRDEHLTEYQDLIAKAEGRTI